jgi:hypothetical protein
MNLGNLGDLIQQFTQSGDPEQFDKAAQSAPRSALAGGLASAFRAGETPPFPQMLTQLFKQSNGEQRAGILNQMIAVLGPTLASQAAGGTLSRILSGGGQVTPQQAENVPDEEVEKVAAQTEQKNPSIVDQVSDFYAEHPAMLKSLGGAALAIIMARMAQKGA